MATTRRVLMPDLPGCGFSDRPDASYELGWQAHMIALWLQTLGITQVDAVGHSFGGGVAQMLLFEPTLDVRRLSLVAAGGIGTRVGFWLRLAALPGVVEYLGQPFMAVGTRFALNYYARGSISVQDIERLSEMNAEQGSARVFGRTVADVISWRGQIRHFLHRAHELNTLPPIALFWGDCDEITPIEDALAFTKVVTGVSLVPFSGCGHYPQHEKTHELAHELGRFLDARWVQPASLPRRHAPHGAAPIHPAANRSTWSELLAF